MAEKGKITCRDGVAVFCYLPTVHSALNGYMNRHVESIIGLDCLGAE